MQISQAGMRRDQESWNGQVKISEGQELGKIPQVRPGSPRSFVLPSRPGLGMALGCEWYEAGARRISSFLLLTNLLVKKELQVLD